MRKRSSLIAEATKAFKLLEATDIYNADVAVFVIATSLRQKGWIRRRLTLSDKLALRFKSIAKKAVGKVTSIEHQRFVELEFDRTPDDYEVEVADVSTADYTVIQRELAALQGEEPGVSLSREEAKRLAHRFRYYAIRVRIDSNRQAYLIRHYTQSKTLVPNKGLSVIFDRDGLAELEEAVLSFDDTIHAIIINQHALVLDKRAFFNAFGYVDAIKEMAQHGLNKISRVISISKIEKIESLIAASHPLRLKLTRISRSSYVDKLTIDMVKTTLAKFPNNTVTIEVDSDGGELLAWDDVWDLLKLLGDDLLSSPMTELLYEVNSKSVSR